MFTIKIVLRECSVWGLEALDLRRRFGLPDASAFHAGSYFRECEVSEEFARAHFGRTDTSRSLSVPVSLLVKGDLAEAQGGRIGFADLTPERIRELFLSAEVASLRQRVRDLEAAQEDA